MDTIFYKKATFLVLLFIGWFSSGFSQTITVSNPTGGPFAPGSSIAVRIQETGAFTQGNTYNLYLSNSSGSFASKVLIGSFTGFYTTYINGTIPNGTPAGGNYKLEVESTAPVVTSAPTSAFSITGGTAPMAALGGPVIIPSSPDVFGYCNSMGKSNTYTFTNHCTAGSTVTVEIWDESTHTKVQTLNNVGANFNFTAAATNYTIVVTAQNGGLSSTASYALLNNKVNNSFSVTGSQVICLGAGGGALAYSVDYLSPNGIQFNYPGTVYKINWGDGNTNTYSLDDLKALSGTVSHSYAQTSCGNTVGNFHNVYEVDINPINPYCGTAGATGLTSYATVLASPKNSFTGPPGGVGCTGSVITFVNTSFAGETSNPTGPTCLNQNALYTWTIDGTVVATDVPQSVNYTYTFNTKGTHTIQLDLQNNTSDCPAPPAILTICIQDPPQPKFTLPATTICLPGTITPKDLSVVDNGCPGNTYNWVVNGPGNVTFGGGTSASSQQPEFVFSQPGVYTVNLTITGGGCGPVSAAPQTIIVNGTPNVSMSADFSTCGKGQTFTFDPNATQTHTVISGTAQPEPANTYKWTVTGAAGGTYSFTNGTTSSSQYPQISFNDFDTYTITVTETNNCGTQTKSQKIIFQQSPTVTAGNAQTICQGSTATLAGTITGTATGQQWFTSGTGTFANGTLLNTQYTPSNADIAAGQVILTLQATTTLAAPCDKVTSSLTLTLIPTDIITSPSSETICSGQSVNYNISATNSGSAFTWTAALKSGSASGFQTSGSGNTINDVIINNSGSTDAVVTYTITPTNNGCPGTPYAVNVTIHPLPVITVTPASLTICSNQQANITLASNVPGTSYTWTTSASPGISGASLQTTPQTVTSISDLLINTATTPGQVTYTIIPVGTSNCPGTSKTVTVTVQPAATIASAGNKDEICGTNTTYTLNGNAPVVGNGKWTLTSTQTGITFSDDTDPHAIVSGLTPGTYQFTWTITASSTCSTSSSNVILTVDPPSVGGTTTGQAAVCASNNSGEVMLSGQTGNIQYWESSTDNGATWVQISNLTSSQSYLNLTQTTEYRAVSKSGTCALAVSTPTIITVNQPPILADAGKDQNLCVTTLTTSTTLQGNDPSPFVGVWSLSSGPPGATIVSPNSNTSSVTGLLPGNTYVFQWTIEGVTPCTSTSAAVTVHVLPDVLANFKMDNTSGCGNLFVNFTNTSTSTNGVNFLWDFGDGTTSTLVNPQHKFISRIDGKDTTYTISLIIPDNCNIHPAIKQTITLHSPAAAAILPNQLTACGTFAPNIKNTTFGETTQYDFYLEDDQNKVVQHIVKTDKSNAQFNPITTTLTKDYFVYMVASGSCGVTTTPRIRIVISPAVETAQMFLENNPPYGCVPFQTTFINNSSGGTNFQYNIYSSPTATVPIQTLTAGTAAYNYTFTKPGTYYVTITASTTCGNIESSPRVRVDAYPVPSPDLSANVTSGCTSLVVSLSNLTADDPNTPASSLNYEWDFGDGSPHAFGFTPPAHTYSYKNSPFSVTLTATNNATGCSEVVVKKNLINVESPPATAFIVQPDTVIKIPNYHFGFLDQTTGGAQSWKWTFGDGATSSAHNPQHTYADTGTYKVTLTTINQFGCDSTTVKHVKITGTPGQLFIPNAFMPGSLNTELRTFMPKGSGLQNWKMEIFNNWGQTIWTSTKLDSKGAPVEGWDGTINGAPAPQGVYVWVISASFINGTKWKGMSYNNSLPSTTGVIHLIR